MSRLPQIVRNSFIRLEGLLYQFFNLFKTIFGWLNQLFGFFAKLLGFTDSQYWLEEEGKSSKSTKVEPDTPAKAPQESPPAPATSATRRRPDSKKMEEFLKMAQQAKTSR